MRSDSVLVMIHFIFGERTPSFFGKGTKRKYASTQSKQPFFAYWQCHLHLSSASLCSLLAPVPVPHARISSFVWYVERGTRREVRKESVAYWRYHLKFAFWIGSAFLPLKKRITNILLTKFAKIFLISRLRKRSRWGLPIFGPSECSPAVLCSCECLRPRRHCR